LFRRGDLPNILTSDAPDTTPLQVKMASSEQPSDFFQHLFEWRRGQLDAVEQVADVARKYINDQCFAMFSERFFKEQAKTNTETVASTPDMSECFATACASMPHHAKVPAHLRGQSDSVLTAPTRDDDVLIAPPRDDDPWDDVVNTIATNSGLTRGRVTKVMAALRVIVKKQIKMGGTVTIPKLARLSVKPAAPGKPAGRVINVTPLKPRKDVIVIVDEALLRLPLRRGPRSP
jgi:hypothetical protein